MDVETLLAEYDRDIRAKPFAEDPDFRFEWDGPVFRFAGRNPAPAWNCVIFSDLTEATADDAIARQVAHFRALGHSFEWKLHSHDRPADLGAKLETAGLQPGDAEGLAVLEVAAPLGERPIPPGVEIRRLDDPATFDPLVALSIAVFGNQDDAPGLVAELKKEAARQPDTLSVYAAIADGTMVSAGWIRFHGGSRFASLWGGGTLPGWRGQGIYSALVARRAGEARERGFKWLTVDCSPESRPILERRGFRVVSEITPWIWRAE